MLQRSNIVSSEEEMTAYYAELLDLRLKAAWVGTRPDSSAGPKSRFQPYRWRWRDLRPEALRALELVGTQQAERRVIRCISPGLETGATNTMVANIQIVGPGEIARALELLPGVVAENPPVPRMADFALFGEAVARALGTKPGQFLEVLKASPAGADHAALEGSPIAPTLYRWIRARGAPFTGTPTSLLGELNATANWRAIAEEIWPFVLAPASTPIGEAEAAWRASRAGTRSFA